MRVRRSRLGEDPNSYERELRMRETVVRAKIAHDATGEHDFYRIWDADLGGFVPVFPTLSTDGPITSETARCWVCGAVRSRTFDRDFNQVGDTRYSFPSPPLFPPVNVAPGEPKAPSEFPSLGSLSPGPPTVEGGPGDA